MWHLDLEKLQVNQYDETKSDITLEGELENKTYNFEGNVTPDIQYFELKPKCNSNKTVIFFHGGPAIQTSGKFNTVIATFISKGFRVIAPNPAGSIGRGPAFAELDNGEKRIPKFEQEIIPFVQFILDNSNGPVFIHGGSYGGWIVNMLATNEIGEQIAAASTRNGLGCLTDFFVGTAPWRIKNRSIEYLGHCSLCNHDIDEQLNCERCKEIKISLSPFSNGGNLTIPQLIMFVGKKDTRVPWELSRNFVENHRIEGEEFPQLYPPFENEGHKIKRKGNLIEIMNNIVKLFNDIEE